jgi:hypothetical protein
MSTRLCKSLSLTGLLLLIAILPAVAQQPPPANPVPADPVEPRGVEVQARGPIHEAFASPTAEPGETPLIAQKPPSPIEELPPAEKPAGEATWISGYWHWDEDRKDYLWVSGCWRTTPQGRQWVPGYWREEGTQWQWVPGFWAAVDQKAAKAPEVTYFPTPPAVPQTAPPGPAPDADSFYVPGHWEWRDGRYVWIAGYFARMQPSYVWVPGHYRWTPYGYVYVAGYWDYTLARRGMLYTPVVIDRTVVGPAYVYTPAYAVTDVVVVDSLWIRPACYHYYYGDYYGPAYRRYGFESCIVYSDRHYDSIIVYRSWECRDDPRWRERQINIYVERDAGRAPLPPRTLAQQRAMINVSFTMVAPAGRVAAAQGFRTVPVSMEARVQAKHEAEAAHAAAVEHRMKTEARTAGPLAAPRTAALPASHDHAAAGGLGAAHANPSAGKGPAVPGKAGTTGPGVHPGGTPPAHPGATAGPNQQHPTPPGQQQQQQKKEDPPHPPG